MDATQPTWTAAGKIAFRFFAVYFVLYALPFPFGAYTGISDLWKVYDNLWHQIIPWVGKNILLLSYDITVFPNGSGDTTYNYVFLLTMVAVSLAACIVWTIADTGRTNYSGLAGWLLVAVRYYLAAAMLWYGFAKVFYLQFAYPGEYKLDQTFGESSPMGLLWTFMGFSYSYNLFTGLGEVVGGVLLFFRRTVTIGSLLIFAIMANVVILNFTFDVPVKLHSLHLIIMAAVLISHDRRRVLNFAWNRESKPLSNQDRPHWPRLRIQLLTKIIVIAYFIGSIIWRMAGQPNGYDVTKEAAAALRGQYFTKEFSFNGTKEFRLTDTLVWRSLKIQSGRAIAVSSGDHATTFMTRIDTVKNTIRLQTPNDRYDLYYRQAGNGILELWGSHLDFRRPNSDTVRIILKQTSKEHLLTTRGFNWVNEYPYNR